MLAVRGEEDVVTRELVAEWWELWRRDCYLRGQSGPRPGHYGKDPYPLGQSFPSKEKALDRVREGRLDPGLWKVVRVRRYRVKR